MDWRFFCFENSHTSLERSHYIKISFSSTTIFVKQPFWKNGHHPKWQNVKVVVQKIGIAVNWYFVSLSMIFPIDFRKKNHFRIVDREIQVKCNRCNNRKSWYFYAKIMRTLLCHSLLVIKVNWIWFSGYLLKNQIEFWKTFWVFWSMHIVEFKKWYEMVYLQIK